MLLGALLLLAANLGDSSASAQGAGSAYRSAVIADAPTSFWRLGELVGTSAVDETGRAPGTYAGGPTLGRQGALVDDPNPAVLLDGVNDQMSATAGALNLTAGLSLEAWVKPTKLPSSGQAHVVNRQNQYALYFDKTGKVSFQLWKANGSKAVNVAKAVAVNAWSHLVATYDGATMRLYDDGVLRASAAYAAPLASSTAATRLGSAGTTSWLSATLDEVAIYDKALPAARISAHYDAATIAQPPPDTTPPAVTLTQPAEGSSGSDPRPTFSGAAGNEAGDNAQVTVKLYAGAAASGSPVQTLNTNRSGASWSVTATDPLAVGTYTARAEQSDAAGNTGLSGTRTFTVTAPAVPSYEETVIADNPRAYWLLGESSGTAAVDRMGNHNGVYEFAPSLGQPGVVGGSPDTAVRFDGIDDQVRVPNTAALNSANAFSVEAWMKPAQLPSYTSTIARKSGQFQLRLRYDGALSLIVWKNGTASTEVRTAKGLIATDSWYHVVVTYDGAELKLWVDGQPRGSLSIAAPLSTSTSSMYLASSGGYDWFDGTLDEVALYHSALSPTRITAHLDRAYLIDTRPPTIALKTPTAASTMHVPTNFGGKAGTGIGDRSDVTVRVWSGSQATGVPARVIETTASASGSFSALAEPPLPAGTYTARAEQSDSAGNLGLSETATFTVDTSSAPTLLAAGDVAHCSSVGDEATADVLDGLGGTVAMLGDAAYEYGTPAEFANCYDPSWGRHRARTALAIPGDHDYGTPNASAYFNYFGAAAGDPSKGYWSTDMGSWHIVGLNSVCYELGWCESAMETWLENDLEASQSTCTVALLHEPLFSSGNIHGNNPGMHYLWQIMYNAGVDVVLSGSEHIYERFAKQTPNGVADPQRGIREFIVGTGGRSHYSIGTIKANSQVRNTDSFGILKLTLNPGSYDWQFVPEAGKSFTDSGTTACH